jgi:hypothetical protein
MKFKSTKWATHKYSEDEAEAQRIWQRAEKRRSNILDGLQTCNWPVKREEYHKLLDKRLDQIAEGAGPIHRGGRVLQRERGDD